MQKVYVLCAPNNKIIWGSGQNWLVNDFPKLHHAFFSKKKPSLKSSHKTLNEVSNSIFFFTYNFYSVVNVSYLSDQSLY